MMASSQVEIAATSPFGGCAVHNRRDPCFQNNINSLVISNDGSRPVDLTDLWVHRPQWQTTATTSAADGGCRNDESSGDSSINKNNKCNDSDTDATNETHGRKDKWARAREMFVQIGQNSGDCGGQKSPNQCSQRVPSTGGVSSLVQKWRGFEAEAKNLNCKGNSAAASQQDNASSAAASPENTHPGSPPPATIDDDPFGDWESDKTPLSGTQSSRGRDSDATESERLRVADIIRKLTEERLNDVVSDLPPRIRSPSEQSEPRSSSSPVVISPRIMIRGRQAYNDLLMQMERDRCSELERLVGRKAVSKFSHRGRIQAMLRVRFLRRGLEAKESYRPSNSASSESHNAVQSAIVHFRERVNVPSAQNGSTPAGSCRKELTDNPSVQNSGPASQKEKRNLCEEISKEVTDSKLPAAPNSWAANQKEKENQCQQISREIKDTKPTASISCATNQKGRENQYEEVSEEARDSKTIPPTLYAANEKEKNSQRQEITNSNSPLMAKKDNIRDSEGFRASKEHEDVDHTSEKVNDDKQQKACPSWTCIRQETDGESSSDTLVKLAETIQSVEINSADSSRNLYSNSLETTKPIDNIQNIVQNKEEEDCNNHRITETNYNLTVDFAQPQIDQDLVESDVYWVSDASHPDIGWEELHSDCHQEEENHTDWIDEVSRPRSDWEGLRQARYQEMLDPFLDNEEIRTLLGRSCVSSFLSSGLREKIDQLMITRTQGPQTPKNNHKQEQKQQPLPEPAQAVASEREDEQDEGEDFGDYYGEYEEVECSAGQQYNESDEYADQITSSAAASAQNQGHELIDHSYSDPFPSTQQSPCNSFLQDHGTSYNAHPTIEMELMYDLRGHMEQLHQEMSELRKSIKCCMDMQIKIESSIKKEVAIAVNASDGNNGRRDSTRRCRVCRKTQVDSLLYRCGHMCTCFKCAHELQWSSGKCPICSAPIVDIVRANSNCS